MKKVWFITGSARGLGNSITKAVLASGDNVAATARHPEQLKELHDQYKHQLYPLHLDVTHRAQIKAAVEHTIKHFGRIDVLVNNAGFGTVGAAEAFTDEQVASQLATNLYAPIEITRTILPYMRAQRSGRIIQISSIGGRIGNAGLSIYQAAKFGISGFSEALAQEVAPLGILVTAVEPGGFRTDWAGTSMTFAPKVEGYEKTVDWLADFISSDKFTPMGDPEKAAKVIVELAKHPEPPVHLVLGSEAVNFLRHADAMREAEFEKWLPVSISTDAKDAIDFFETEAGKRLGEGLRYKV